jgi:hypothetical protein
MEPGAEAKSKKKKEATIARAAIVPLSLLRAFCGPSFDAKVHMSSSFLDAEELSVTGCVA